MTLREALLFLAEREVARRDARRIQMDMKLARFPYVCTLEGFDFDAQPSIDPGQIRDLATGRWIGHGQALLLLGPPGVGAVALGREAVERGYTVLFTTAAALMAGLMKTHADGRLEEKLPQLAKPKLLIIDELGYLLLEPAAAHLFFQLVSRRYERASVLITSNRLVGEWARCLAMRSLPPPTCRRVDQPSGVNSRCRQGVKSSCRLTNVDDVFITPSSQDRESP